MRTSAPCLSAFEIFDSLHLLAYMTGRKKTVSGSELVIAQSNRCAEMYPRLDLELSAALDVFDQLAGLEDCLVEIENVALDLVYTTSRKAGSGQIPYMIMIFQIV